MLNERSGDDWLLSSDPLIAIPLERCFRPSPRGLPTLVAKVLMFYKATAYPGTPGYSRPRDEADFLALLPHLGEDERRWLREAISVVVPGHSWLWRITE